MKISFSTNFPAELRLFQIMDAEKLFSLVDRNRIYLRQWLPWLDESTAIEDTLMFIRQSLEQHLDNSGFQAGIWYNNELAGAIGFHPIDWQNKIAVVGYWLGEEFQKKGIMKEACRAIVTFAFDEYKMNRVEIKCATGNVKSCAIPERLGFTKEGVIRDGEWLYDHYVDLVLYSMLARNWKNPGSLQ